MPGPANSERNAETRAERLVAKRYVRTFLGLLAWCRKTQSLDELAAFHTLLRLEASSVVDGRTVEITANELTSFTSTSDGPATSYAEDHRFTFVRSGSAWRLANDVVLSCGTMPSGFSGQECVPTSPSGT